MNFLCLTNISFSFAHLAETDQYQDGKDLFIKRFVFVNDDCVNYFISKLVKLRF